MDGTHAIVEVVFQFVHINLRTQCPGAVRKITEGNAQLNTVNEIYISEELNEVCLICTLQFFHLNIIMISMFNQSSIKSSIFFSNSFHILRIISSSHIPGYTVARVCSATCWLSLSSEPVYLTNLACTCFFSFFSSSG